MTVLALPRATTGLGTRLSTVKAEVVTWLWRYWLALGKIALLDGDPGLGKSLLITWLASRVTRGLSMPDGSPGLDGGVVFMSAEDGLADTLVPRFMAAGGDLERISDLATLPRPEGGRRVFQLPDDIPALLNEIALYEAKLVVIDPLMAFMGSKVNTYRDQDVRRALAPLALAADKHRFAVLVVRHLNKGDASGNPLYRGGGSIAFIGAARNAMLVAPDPDDSTRGILAPTKSNLGPLQPALAYRIDAVDDVPVIRWDGTSSQTADTLLSAQSAEEKHGRVQAREFLVDALAAGAVDSSKLIAQAEAHGVKSRTLWRAKKELSVVARKTGFDGGWTWELPR